MVKHQLVYAAIALSYSHTYTHVLTGADVDYNSGPYAVTFAARMTATSFSILITDDKILEGNETFYLTIDPSSLRDDTNVDVGNLFQITVIIVEDDCEWRNEFMYYA